MPYEALLSTLILGTSLLVLFDAKGLGARKGRLGGGLLDMGYVGWFVACLLLWIIAFPCYLIKRPRLVWARTHHDIRTPAVPAVPVQYAPSYTREYAQAYGLPWTESLAPPAPVPPATVATVPSSRGVQLAGVVAIVAAIGICVGGGLQSEPAAAGNTVGAPAAATTRPPSDAETLAQITLRTGDFHNGYRVQLVPGGDQVAGQVTLDNCGHHFVTESARVARRQVEVVNGAGQPTDIGNEVVAYRTTALASAALREWYTATARCPRTPIRMDGVKARIRVSTNTMHVSGLPNLTNVMTVEKLTVKNTGSSYLIGVLQVRGRILDAVYVNQHQVPTERELLGVLTVAAGTGRRLATQ